MKEETLKFIMWVFGKLFSARFLVLVALMATFCFMTLKVTDAYLTVAKASTDLPPGVKEVALIIIGAFIASVNTVVAFYFLRTDRKTQ